MATTLAVITTLGVLITILANLTNILRYVSERRERHAAARGQALAEPLALATTQAPPPTRPPPAAAAQAGAGIFTPDRRLRVFVSSTLHELARERELVKRAIEELFLTPVMFELGARPHPPAELYRAYLAQSDVFVGIYAESYGWVAPGAQMSGIEDEYDASAALPSLIYVKKPVKQREERLEALLERVRRDGRASYRSYAEPEELADLLGNDLALLLTERFHHPATHVPAFTLRPPAVQSANGQGPETSLDAYIGPPSGGAVELVPKLPLQPTPVALTSFVGRDETLTALVELLRQPEARLVTLHGPGGIGKSRLALEAARELAPDFADGVGYVPLDSVRDPELVPGQIALALGLQETAAAGPMERLARVLLRRQLLLVLDNFEGLLPAGAMLTRLLGVAKGLKVIVTSRNLLRLTGEVPFPVPPMSLPGPDQEVTPESAIGFGSVRLFVERARALRPGFTLDATNVDAVIAICRRLDGLPLSIELAAARLGTMSVAALEERMVQRLPLLTGGPRDAPERQQTLKAAIAWSFDLLSPPQQTLFARMALFEGGAYLEAIENVLGVGQDVLGGLEALVEASLLDRLDADDGRLGMLETLREFALEVLAKDPELERLRRAHARYYLALARGVPNGLQGRDQREWLERLRLEEGNLRNAGDWFIQQGDAAGALGLAVALRPYWLRVGALEEGRRRLTAARAVPGEVGVDLRAESALASGVLAWRQGDLAAAGTLLETAMQLAKDGGVIRTSIDAQRALGVLAQNHADFGRAARLLEESARLATEHGDKEAVSSTYLSLGNVALDQDRAAVATACYRKSLELAKGMGDKWGEAMALDNLSVAAWYTGDLGQALSLADEAFTIYERLELASGCANVWHRKALVAIAQGDLDTAETQGRVALRVKRAQGEARGAAFVIYDLARVALARKDAPAAAHMLAEGLALALPQRAPALDLLYLEGSAGLLAMQGRLDEANVLARSAAVWRERLGIPVAPVNRRQSERLKAKLDKAMQQRPPKERNGLNALARQLTLPEALERAATALGGPRQALEA